ncbi:MFS transporter [Chloroflexota bacterium]
MLRHKPEKYGYLPDGAPPPLPERLSHDAGKVQQDTAQTDGSFSTIEAIRSRAFWLIALGHASAVWTVAAVSLHVVPHLVEQLSMSLEAAGGIVALMLMVTVVGRVVGGFLADRINKRVVLVACMFSHTLGLLMLAYATSMVYVFSFAIFHGLAWGARVPAQISIRADYFGRKSIGLILGISSIVPTAAAVVAPIFAGWMADVLGDYRLAFTILAILTAFGALFFAFASKPTRKYHAVSDGQMVT